MAKTGAQNVDRDRSSSRSQAYKKKMMLSAYYVYMFCIFVEGRSFWLGHFKVARMLKKCGPPVT